MVRMPFQRADGVLGVKSPGAIPNLSGSFSCNGTYGASLFNYADGPFLRPHIGEMKWRNDTVQWSGATNDATIAFNASNVSSVYSNVGSVYPISLSIKGWLIKYI